MRYAHLCHNIEGAARPDRTACQVLCRGFCDPQNFVKAIVSIATMAKATDISTDNLLLMVESTGQTQLVCPRENLRCKLIQNLNNHCAHTRHHSTMHTPAFDVFHDLLNNFEQCNSATLMSNTLPCPLIPHGIHVEQIYSMWNPRNPHGIHMEYVSPHKSCTR